MCFFGGPCLVIILAALIWPASAPAQATNPPSVHSFDVGQPSNVDEGDADELILTDWFNLPDESSPSNQSSMPSLPPSATPASSAPATDSGPPAGPPLVNIPTIPAPAESQSLSAPLKPPAVSPAQTPPPEPAPAKTAPPAQVPAGYTPLPTVPLQPASQPGIDPFALPPTSAPEAAHADPAAPPPTENRTVPLGRKQEIPDPQWNSSDQETTPSQSQIISGAPLPQFDSSQSPWIQLEIGQGDGSGQVPPAASRPTSVYSLPDPAAKPLEPVPAAPVEALMDASTDQVLDQAISQPPTAAGGRLDTPAGREQLRNLFSDMMPPESEGARAPVVNPPASPAATKPASTLPLPGPAVVEPRTQPRESDQTGQDRGNVGSSSILRAGELLNLEEYVGAAEILPPLSGRPRQPLTETPAKPSPVPVKQGPAPKALAPKPDPPAAAPPAKAAPAKTAPKPAAKSAPSKASGTGKAKKGASKKTGGAQAVSPAPVGLGLIIINETGRDRVGQQYRSVLAQMGYQVVSVGDGQPGRGTAGQTVINYRPGLKAKAQAVARHLPGKKVLVEAKKGQVLASEIMIYIR